MQRADACASQAPSRMITDTTIAKTSQDASGLFLFSALAMLLGPELAVRAIVAGVRTPMLLLLAGYQDIFVWAILLWNFGALPWRCAHAQMRQVALIVGWIACLLVAAMTALHLVIYSYLATPLTFRMIAISQTAGGIGGSFSGALRAAFLYIAQSMVFTLLAGYLLSHRAPTVARSVRRWICSRYAVCVLIVFCVTGRRVLADQTLYSPGLANPVWALVESAFQPSAPKVTKDFPREYLKDFRPESKFPTPGFARITLTSAGRRLNVVMIVMESVGTRRLQLYGAPYENSPQMVELARHGEIFTRVYVGQALSSSSMAALFCSVYPELQWFAVTRLSSKLPIPGLPAILAKHGYRTAFMHPGTLSYDSDGEFLKAHGFETLVGRARDENISLDNSMLDSAVNWISADQHQPFFLTLWTMDTHHPYPAQNKTDYGVRDPFLNRYFNAIRTTDDLIARLVKELEQMGLADDTLLVITGDHGEAFGEHGRKAHGFTVYDEEIHVPLLLVNPAMFPKPVVNDSLVRQIDIAPTLLDMLGMETPAQWQGTSIFGAPRPERAYSFAAIGKFTFGLIENRMKYVYDFEDGRAELYDLVADPLEYSDLSRDPKWNDLLAEDRLRIEAWMSFQNQYLASARRDEAPVGRYECRRGTLKRPRRPIPTTRSVPALSRSRAGSCRLRRRCTGR